MGLKVTKTSSAASFNSITKLWSGPYDQAQTTEQDELSIVTAIPGTTILSLFANTRAFASIRNTSTGGQQIRFGPVTPSFTAPVIGQLLLPGEEWQGYDLEIPILAIADTAGALVSRFIVRSSGI